MLKNLSTHFHKSSSTLLSINNNNLLRNFYSIGSINTSLKKINIQQLIQINNQQERNYGIPRRVKRERYFKEQEEKEWRDKGKQKYVRQTPEVNNTFIIQQLQVLKLKRNWRRAYKLFKEVEAKRGRPIPQVYRLFLYTIGTRGGEMTKAFEVFKYMLKNQSTRDVKAFNIMLQACAKHNVAMNDYILDHNPNTNYFTTAVKLYNELKQSGEQLSSFTITYMAACVEKAMKEALINEETRSMWLKELKADAEDYDVITNPHVVQLFQPSTTTEQQTA
ncbi:hypothetical protein ABK040_005463 [Willaertia magna]